MSTVTRVAGVAGTFTYTLNQIPAETPTLTVYSDAGRTVVAVAETTLDVTANPAVFTASYPADLDPGLYYLQFQTVFTTGQPALVDNDDDLTLLTATGTVGLSVTTGDVEDRWRPLTGVETTVAGTLLGDAEAMVAARFPTVSTIDVTLYRAVIVAMVVRILRNPDGFTQESVGDWSGSRAGAEARSSMYLSDEEATLLSEALGLGSTEAFTITPYYSVP